MSTLFTNTLYFLVSSRSLVGSKPFIMRQFCTSTVAFVRSVSAYVNFIAFGLTAKQPFFSTIYCRRDRLHNHKDFHQNFEDLSDQFASQKKSTNLHVLYGRRIVIALLRFLYFENCFHPIFQCSICETNFWCIFQTRTGRELSENREYTDLVWNEVIHSILIL